MLQFVRVMTEQSAHSGRVFGYDMLAHKFFESEDRDFQEQALQNLRDACKTLAFDETCLRISRKRTTALYFNINRLALQLP